MFAALPELAPAWSALAGFVWIERSGVRQGKALCRHSGFIISQLIEAQQIAAMIRAHRGTTENQLHGVKDGVQGEDASLIQAPNPATLMALLRSWAITLFRKAGQPSITKAIRRFRIDCLLST